MSTATSFLPYHEPGIVTILIQSSLLLILNIINTLFDKLIFCGLLGQVFIGVAWGTPGAAWLDVETEHVIVQLGYLGLILLVYEGGLETDFRSVKSNLLLSVAVAATGIGFPMALSFFLRSLVDATSLQAFAAGAALSATSLGTTFTILGTSGLSSTRLGTVLSSAAMIDDVVGLIMVQVISNLGQSAGPFEAVTVVRPLAVSLGMAIAVPLACRFVALPVTLLLNGMRKSRPHGVVNRICQGTYTAFVTHTLILLGLVTGTSYAGTSVLFAAYLAGASISWWDSEVPHLAVASPPSREDLFAENHSSGSPEEREDEQSAREATSETSSFGGDREVDASTGKAIYHKYYAIAVQRILKPFFFASIGFAIPVTDMFTGPVVWRGVAYTTLMLLGKLVTGVWLVRIDISWPKVRIPSSTLRSVLARSASCLGWPSGNSTKKNDTTKPQAQNDSRAQEHASNDEVDATTSQSPPTTDPLTSDPSSPPSSSSNNKNITHTTHTLPSAPPPPSNSPQIPKPLSLYPAAMLGTAMTARGEIGFLIASLAETTGLFAASSGHENARAGSSEIYLVVTWAIVLCTIIGPLGIGTLVKRVKRLQWERKEKGVGVDPLGIWGVS
ncbi:Na+/H+ antiporter [Drepanopeziza brunnea f. sp. 'multigermtubi' MB_m1]|uniref:Na+/H+ antiporter n=1 Tax=Marssonina brunnea f. sp. multigermtubi (strain MB_m1) TaxID=1072389 RepID=K1WRE3_MARBU|nr:Na+/H+ antiporter [Drepanopeziza brunnea f. sp. 'multigermtubi' MB_m1]EKD20205.1 Na+/H+ antiporter [Drepanopeziza brunnea f. sp. 'multigermtubi' MB_m1]